MKWLKTAQTSYSEEKLEKIRQKLEFEQVNTFINAISGASSSASNSVAEDWKESIFKEIDELLKKIELEEIEQKRKQQEAEAEKKYLERKHKDNNGEKADSAVWSAEEENALTRALVKYPVGTQNRWDIVTDFVNSFSKVKRSVKEVIKKQKLIDLGERQIDEKTAYAQYVARMSKEQSAALAEKEKEEERRKKEKEEQEREEAREKMRMREMEIQYEKEKAGKIPQKTQTPKHAPPAPAPQKKAGSTNTTTLPSTTTTSPSSSVTTPAASAFASASTSAVVSAASAQSTGAIGLKDEWSSDEQALFEKALRSVAKDDADRWEKIAAIVKSKNKKQCVQRFKEIREALLKQKGAAAPPANTKK